MIALDRVLANIDKSGIVPRNVEGIKADPPTIFFSKVPAVIVNLDAEPIWSSIKGNDLKFAVNTNWDLFEHEPTKALYLRNNDNWLKATDIKPEEIYQIPASSPAHHVTYVTVEEDDDDDWVVFAAAAGCSGMMVAWGCTMWGTGWYCPPYWGYGPYYPYYYPYFPTYGYSWYNPWTGAWGRSAAVYGPYGGAGVGARYNPRTGTYAATRQGSNVYGSWGSTAVQRGDDWARTNRYTNRQTGTTTRTIRTDEGSAITRGGAEGGRACVEEGGNVYAGGRECLSSSGRHVAEVREWQLVEHRQAARETPTDRAGDDPPAADRGSQHGREEHEGPARS